MRFDASRDPKQECCGLMAGRSGVISANYPAENAAANPASSYEIAPRDLFRIMREIRAAGLAMLGIFHSHPRGNNEPSRTDIANAYYPDAAYFILSPQPDAPRPVRAFAIGEGVSTELEIEIVES